MKIYAISIALKFPAGVASTDSEEGNILFLTQNGAGEYIIPGTSLAGILRHRWRRYCGKAENDTEIVQIFGRAADVVEDNAVEEEAGDKVYSSPLYVPDAILNIGEGEVKRHTYHRRNRHTGAVLGRGVFTIETLPPQTTTAFTLWLEARDQEISNKFIDWLSAVFREGVIFGGNSNRGVGLAELEGMNCTEYDLSDSTRHGEYLAARREVAAGEEPKVCSGENNTQKNSAAGEGTASTETVSKTFSATITLKIPRGQDVLFAEKGHDIKMVPMRVTAADGKDYWRLPGSSLHGLFRDWSTRLAARSGIKVADSAENYKAYYRKNEKENEYTSHRISELFIPEEKKQDAGKRADYISGFLVDDLFGSSLKAGRIHITDGFSQVSNKERSVEYLAASNIENCEAEVQKRDHVAINSISGGVFNTGPFPNAVLVNNGNNSPEWQVKILIQNPKDIDVCWLAHSLIALHIGLLRVGSSKSAGRLEIAGYAVESGEHRGLFKNALKLVDVEGEANGEKE